MQQPSDHGGHSSACATMACLAGRMRLNTPIAPTDGRSFTRQTESPTPDHRENVSGSLLAGTKLRRQVALKM